MKKALSRFLISATLTVWGNALAAGTSCTASSDYSSHATPGNAANGDDGYCFYTPDSLNVTIYEFGLCVGHATPAVKQNCVTLFESATGRNMNLSAGQSLALSDSVSLSPGSFSHAYIVLSNVTSIKAAIKFNSPRSDDQSNSGEFCHTDGRSFDNGAQSIVSCSNNAANAVESVETIGLVDNNGGYASSEVITVTMGGENVVTNLYMMDAGGALSTQYANDFAIFGSQELTSSVNLSENTTNLDIAFSITDGVALGFDDLQNNANAPTGPIDFVFQGIKFKITAN